MRSIDKGLTTQGRHGGVGRDGVDGQGREDLHQTLAFRDVDAPGPRCSWRRVWRHGSWSTSGSRTRLRCAQRLHSMSWSEVTVAPSAASGKPEVEDQPDRCRPSNFPLRAVHVQSGNQDPRQRQVLTTVTSAGAASASRHACAVTSPGLRGAAPPPATAPPWPRTPAYPATDQNARRSAVGSPAHRRPAAVRPPHRGGTPAGPAPRRPGRGWRQASRVTQRSQVRTPPRSCPLTMTGLTSARWSRWFSSRVARRGRIVFSQFGKRLCST